MNYDERLSHMLSIAERCYGPRNHQRTLLPIRFHHEVPQIFYPSQSEIEIRLGPGCETDHVRGCYQLAHEAIHVLSPVNHYNTTTLEEGLATSFAHSYIREHIGTDWMHSGDARYDTARALVECFLSPRPNAILQLRGFQPVISLITADLIQQVYPDIPISLARQFVTFFYVAPTSQP